MVKILKTRDTVLDKEKIKENLTKIASASIVTSNCNTKTYPIPRVKDNCEYISLVYTLLSDHVKLEIPIHPAGEWILDNFYIIERSAKTVSKELTKSKYRKLPGLKDSGFARIYVLANEIVCNTDGKIKSSDLVEYLEAYQSQKHLTMEEIWNFGVFIQICIIEKIRIICEKIFISQIQKSKALDIVERLVENKPSKKISVSVEGKYSFIEFMSYKLRKYGKIYTPYLNALDEQVRKAGMTLQEVTYREHFDIAVKTLSMKNCITSIKNISRIDIIEIFKKVNIVEKILNQDPAGVYKKMDYKTKGYYRTKILEIANKSRLSEIYVAEQILQICKEKYSQNKKEKETHVGYYLIDEGKEELLTKILNKRIHVVTYKEKARNYIMTIYLTTLIATLVLAKPLKWYSIILLIPIQNAVTQIIQYILSKIKKARLIPKLNYAEGIPKESPTMCILPTILKNKQDVEKMMEKMEIYYLANESENLFFTLLGDCTQSNKEKEKEDEEIINTGKEITHNLNKKYGDIFFFTYRRREWSQGERKFMGWERKRGLISQYNEFLVTGKSNFWVNTCKIIPKIKYVITLDEDTNLILNSAFELVGAMDHILNKPEVDKIKNIVTKGHAIIQPRIELNIDDGRKTNFSRIFAGNGGTDLYTNAISNVYQDNFDEGIYTGKGIYDLSVFYKVLKDTIPENKVLSHDLLEGSYLRCGLASDIVLTDGYPSKYNSYKTRIHRWIRGDIQILSWLKSDLNQLSKYKIIDNIVRNMNEEFVFIALIVQLLTIHKYLLIPLLIYATPLIIKLTDNIINQKGGIFKHKLFVPNFSKWTHSLYKFIVNVTILPDVAFLQIDAITRALYRMKISHSNLLEWTTSDEAEKKLNNNYRDYLQSMKYESFIAITINLYAILNIYKFNLINSITLITLALLWSFSTVIMWKLSQKNEHMQTLNIDEKNFLTTIAKKTWLYFKENLVNNLPADNYQEDRKEKVALRTSPTNIGLAMLSAIAIYDLKIETLDETIKLINNMLETVNNLQKWNGHLYNWYDIKKLEPLHPYDISSVDSGNFVGCLYTVKQFLKEHYEKDNTIKESIKLIDKIILETDFKKLYNYEIGLFSIGFSVEQNKLYDSYYDLLASEARQTSLIAIAKKDVPAKHWNNLGRTLTRLREHKGLVSWGGTAFEYLMPNIIIPTYPSSLIDESCKLLVLSDMEYAQKLNVPWGMSEAAYSLKDFYGNYQYKTFGIPWLGLKRGLDDDVVVSPYSSALALMVNSGEAIQNLRKLEKKGLLGKYGFFDSIDYKPKMKIVKTYMAHHQGMILTSIDNVINSNILQKRFMRNPELQGVKILLQENMPEDVIITKEKKEKAKRIKYKGYEKSKPRTNGINVISSQELSNMTGDDGVGYTKFNDTLINNEVNIYLKNLNTNKIYNINEEIKQKTENLEIKYTPYSSKIKVEDGNIKTTVTNIIAPNSQVEIRKIKIENKGIENVNIEVTSYTEPILSNIRDHMAHPTYNKMFLKYEYKEPRLIVTRKKRKENEDLLYLVSTLYSQEGNLEFEIDKEKFVSRGNNKIPDAVESSKPLSKKIETVINPIIAFKKMINIEAGNSKNVYLITSVNKNKDEALQNLDEYENEENLSRVFELAKAQTEAEIRYMGITENKVNTYQKMAKYLLMPRQNAFDMNNNQDYKKYNLDLSNKKLWQYGISGDYPLLVFKLKEQNGYEEVIELLKAYEYFLSKHIELEVIIITNSDIKAQIANSKAGKYLNKKNGIFVLENLKYDESKIIEARANLLLDSHNGTLEIQMRELEKNKQHRIIKDDIIYEPIKTIPSKKKLNYTKYKELKYHNEYGAFNDEGNEYWIKQSKTKRIPTAWSNIMANKNFGTVVTDSLGGFTWYINSQTNKITKFSNDAYMDSTSERITIKNYNNSEEYYSGFGLGYSHFIKTSNELEQNLTVFVPAENSLKISILRLKNYSNQEKNLDIKYDVKLLMGENENNSIIVENYKKNLNMIIARNLMNNNYFTYITSSEKMDKNKEIHVKIMPNEEREIVFLLGTQNTEMECIEKSAKYLTSYVNEFENTKKYWKDKVTRITSKTPLKSFDIMQNGFLVYQSIVSRMYGRTGFYQSSGGYGYRDQLQDAIGMKWVNPDILKEQILLHARHQFEEGDVEHWWHEDTKLGIRTRYSDDLLWLVYAVEEYIDFTGDYSILNEKEKFIKAEPLEEDEQDRVEFYKNYTSEHTIYEHCIKVLKIATVLGNHNLPLVKSGDWNDGMNKIGIHGRGESVWLGFFLYIVINKFITIMNYQKKHNPRQIISKDVEVEINEKGKKELQPTKIEYCNNNEYEELKEKLTTKARIVKKALNSIAWDGRWYLRAFDDNGNKIGSINNEECKIDSICQSFSVLSNAGDNDKKYIAMESLENYLIDEQNNLVKLLTPALENTDLGYISSYAKGMRENGGQYTHECCSCGQFWSNSLEIKPK